MRFQIYAAILLSPFSSSPLLFRKNLRLLKEAGQHQHFLSFLSFLLLLLYFVASFLRLLIRESSARRRSRSFFLSSLRSAAFLLNWRVLFPTFLSLSLLVTVLLHRAFYSHLHRSSRLIWHFWRFVLLTKRLAQWPLSHLPARFPWYA